MKCDDCGTQMKLLLYSYYCPNDCDRKRDEPPLTLKETGIFISEDDSHVYDPDITPPYGFPMFGPHVARVVKPCPKCGSTDTEDFSFGQYHCWPCGHVW